MSSPVTFDLSHDVALVTGASSGLGAHFASVLAQAGAKVVIAGRRAEGIEHPCPAFSFGVAQCPDEAAEFDKLVQLADARLIEAKQAKQTAR